MKVKNVNLFCASCGVGIFWCGNC